MPPAGASGSYVELMEDEGSVRGTGAGDCLVVVIGEGVVATSQP